GSDISEGEGFLPPKAPIGHICLGEDAGKQPARGLDGVPGGKALDGLPGRLIRLQRPDTEPGCLALQIGHELGNVDHAPLEDGPIVEPVRFTHETDHWYDLLRCETGIKAPKLNRRIIALVYRMDQLTALSPG